MAHEGKRHPIAGSGNTSVAALLKKNQTNNESLFKAIASEKSHINQIGSATPDFNTVMKNYGTFSDKTWKRKVADEKARVTAFTSMPDDKSQTQLTDFDKNTKLKRKIEAENEIERVQNVKQDLLRQELSEVAPGDDVSRVYDFEKQGQYQPKPVVEEKPSLVLDETTGIQTTASGQQLDAIGREINQLTTDVGQVSYSGKNTDDIAYAAQAAVVADVALTKSVKEAEKKLKIQQYDDLQAKQLADSLARTLELNKQAGIDESAFVRAGDVKSRITKIEEKKADEVKAAAAAADAAAAVARAAENLAWGVENLKQEKIKESALVRAGDVKSRIAKVEKEKEKAAKLAKKIALREFNATNAAADLKLQRIAREQEIAKAEAAFTRKKEDTRQNKLIEERADASDKAADLAAKKAAQKAAEAQLEQEATERAVKRALDEAELVTAKKQAELDKERAEKAAASKRQRIADVKERTSALQREREDKRQNDLIDDTANKSDEAVAKVASEREDKRQNDLIDSRANKSDAFYSQSVRNRKNKEEKLQAAKLKKDLETADRIGSKMDRDNDRSKDPVRFSLTGDPYAFSNLSYPYNVTNSRENGHYVLFYVNVQNKTKYLYNTPQVGVTVGDYIEKPAYFSGGEAGQGYFGSGSEYIEGEAGTGAAAGPIAYQSQTIKNGAPGNILRNNMKFLQKSRKAPYAGINSRYPTTTRITDSVALYLPTGIGNTTTATYGDSETGVAGYLALSGLDIIQDVQDLDFAGATDKLFGVGGTLIKEAVKKIGIKSLQALTETEGLAESFDKIFGQTLNPYIEVTYTSFGMRTFDYTFQFAPESARESDEVKAIIQLFRFHMAPEMKGDAHRYLTLPSTFDIHYMFQSGMGDEAVAKENSFYNKIATCVLTSVDVNYTPNEGVKSFADGAPTQLSMALSFQETEMLTKQKINDGF